MARFVENKHFWGLLVTAALGAALAFVPHVDAASFLPLPQSADLNVPSPEGDTAVQKVENILGPIGRVIRIVMGSIAVLFIVFSGVSIVMQADAADAVKKQKNAINAVVIGLLMLSIAGPVAALFDFRQGNFLENPDLLVERAQLFDNTTRVIITFVKYFLGAYAVAMLISAGASMVGSSSTEDTLKKAKKGAGLAVSGLLLVVVSDLFIRRIFFDAKYNDTASRTLVSINQNELIRQMVAITNLMVTFVGPIVMLVFMAGALLYVTAGGKDDQIKLAQKIMTNAVIGIVIIYGAFALVSSAITGIYQ